MLSQPIFLVGAERSGTTVLRLMLDHHPELAFHHESEFMVSQLPEQGWPDLAAYHAWLRCDRVFLHSKFEIDPELDYPNLQNSFLEQKRARDSKPLVGATVHHRFDRLVDIWPDARLIHIVRDPRDVARSVVTMGWSGNVWDGAGRWLEAEAAWDRLSARIAPETFLEVRYLDLIQDCRGVLERICQFIGISFDERMLSYPETTSYHLPDAQFVEQWKAKLTPRQVQLIEARLGEMLTARGFVPSGFAPITIPTWRQQMLLLHSRLGRARFRMRRYGPWLFGQDLLARRLGPQSWADRLKPALDQIDEKFIR